MVASDGISFQQLAVEGEDVYWIEMRPSEGGRSVLTTRGSDGRTVDVTSPPFNARTTVHEYGGGAFAVSGGVAYFSNFNDQRVYRVSQGSPPEALTPQGDLRYADGVVDQHRNRLICVREDHTIRDGEAVNTLVSIDVTQGGSGDVLVSGNDFYSSPRLSPDGSTLAWLTWNHPNMPWDRTELWIARIERDDCLGDARRIAGGVDESVFQPEWSPDGILFFVSDRTNWWNLYRWDDEEARSLNEMGAEFGKPQWIFGMSTYAFESSERLICAVSQEGEWSLAAVDPRTGEMETLGTRYSRIWQVRSSPGRALFFGGSPIDSPSLISLELATGELSVLRRSRAIEIDDAYFSTPHAVEFPTEGGMSSHAFFYEPVNPDYVGPQDETPPLLVVSHGGPTSATSSMLNLAIQYWTSRGIAVVDVNYRGSTGYGRDYRKNLYGEWGVVDVEDCVNAALHLVGEGLVDKRRLAIRGGSAGGYTTLCALTFRDVFSAGASYYGVSDLELLTKDTHKFESRYLDQLVGPYPERQDLYHERSPIRFTDRLACPVIFFQGLEDKVVPPNQAEMMVDALKHKGLPVAYVPFEGEQHGLRQSESIRRALDAELYFYSEMFGFELADPVEPVLIHNL